MAAIAKKVLYKKNSQFLRVAGLKDQSVTPAVYLNAAAVTATLKDKTGAAVTGFSGVTGTYVAASNGTYDFPVDPVTFDPPVDSTYTLVITLIQNGKQLYAELPAQVSTRKQGTEV
jgi:hypothetical protein